MSKKTLQWRGTSRRLAGRLSPFRDFPDRVWEIRPRRASQGLRAAVVGLCAVDFGHGCPRDRWPASRPVGSDCRAGVTTIGRVILLSRCYTGDWKSMPVSGIVGGRNDGHPEAQGLCTLAVGREAARCRVVQGGSRDGSGLIDADLGGSLYKKRVARPGGGKSGGYRTLVSARIGSRYVFLYGFPKNDKANITQDEKKALQFAGKVFLELSAEALSKHCRPACYWRCIVSKIIESLRGDLAALHEVGAISKVTMRKFDAICPPPVREFGAADIKRLREALNSASRCSRFTCTPQPRRCAMGARRDSPGRSGPQAAQRHCRQGLAGHHLMPDEGDRHWRRELTLQLTES